MDGALAHALKYTLQKGALRARSAERKTEKEKLKQTKQKERERERERRKESRASARALVCYRRRARARSEIRCRKARSARALQRGRQRKSPLCWGLWLGLVLFLSSSCPCFGRAPELCGWALWPGSVPGSCPPLVLVLAAPLNSVAGLSKPYWRGVWPNK